MKMENTICYQMVQNKRVLFLSIDKALFIPLNYTYLFLNQYYSANRPEDFNYDELLNMRLECERKLRKINSDFGIAEIYKLINHMISDSSIISEAEKEFYSRNVCIDKHILKVIREFEGKIILINDTCMSQVEIQFILEEILAGLVYEIVIWKDHAKSSSFFMNWFNCNIEKPEEAVFIGNMRFPVDISMKSMLNIDIYDNNNKYAYEQIYTDQPYNGFFAPFRKYISYYENLNDDSEENCLYNNGVTVLAPLLVSYAEYIIEFAVKKGIRQLCPLMRDGFIMGKILESILRRRNINDISIIPLYVSRKALSNINHTKEFNDNIDLSIIKKSKITIGAYLKNVGLSNTEFPFVDVRLDEAELIRYENTEFSVFDKFYEHLLSSIDHVRKNREYNSTLIFKYLQQNIDIDNDILTIDFGFAGSIGSDLAFLLKESGAKLKVYNMLMCGSKRECLGVIEGNFIRAFLYDMGSDSSAYQYSCFIYSIIENYMMGEEGTTLGYELKSDGNVYPIIESKTTVDYSKNLICHKGIQKYLEYWMNIAEERKDIIRSALLCKYELRGILERLLLFPTEKEALHIGKIRTENSYIGQDKVHCICDAEIINKAMGYNDYLLQEENNKMTWIAGAYAIAYPGSTLLNLINYSDKSRDINYLLMTRYAKTILNKDINKVIIYGFGLKGKILFSILRELGVEVEAFIDRAIIYNNCFYYNIPIYTIEQIKSKGFQNFVIASAVYYNEIKEELQNNLGSDIYILENNVIR